FGLFDMHGNAWQWCEDYYGPYNGDLKLTDPLRTVKHSEERRVLRGGSWDYLAWYCRAACRYGVAPDNRDDIIGFRVAVRLHFLSRLYWRAQNRRVHGHAERGELGSPDFAPERSHAG